MRAPDKAGPIFVLQSNYRSLPSLNLPRAPQRDWIPPRAWRQFSCHTSPASPPRQRPLLGSHRDPCAAELPVHLPRWHPRERGRGPHLGPRFGVGSGVLPRASLSPQQDLGSSPVTPHPYGTFSLGGSGPSCHPRGPLAIPGHLSFSWAHLGSPGPLSSHTSGGAAWLGWHHARPLPVLSPCHGLTEEPVPLLTPRRRKLGVVFAAAPFIPRLWDCFSPCPHAASSGESFGGHSGPRGARKTLAEYLGSAFSPPSPAHGSQLVGVP